jgi:hypothetical protein
VADAVAPWEVLGGERFKTAEQGRRQTGERMDKYSGGKKGFEGGGEGVEDDWEGEGYVAEESRVGLCVEEPGLCFPLLGGRKVEQLRANIEALSVVLEELDVREFEAASERSPGFPYDVLAFGGEWNGIEDLAILTGTFDYVNGPEAIRPRKA